MCSIFLSKRGGMKLNIDGFSFNKNKEMVNKYYWSCEQRNKDKCLSRAITIRDTDNDQHTVLSHGEHNHEPSACKLLTSSVIRELKEESLKNSRLKPCQILQTVLKSTDSDIASQLPTTSALKQIIYREKRKNKPVFVEPKDIYFDINNDYLKLEKGNLVIKDEIFNDNKRVILLSTKKLMTQLGQSMMWYMDGTFKSVPELFLQLYTIHSRILNEHRSTVPLVFVLCTNKDKTTYNKIFDLINEYFCENDIVINVKYCMMDFEITAIQCARQNLENIMVKCCSFHFGQIIYRRIQSSGLAKLYGTDYSFSLEIKCLMALSFLPHSTIPQYFQVWEENCSEKSALIAKWFAENYVVGKNGKPPQFPPSLWSCHDLNHLKLPRTQNNVEAWHHRLNSIVDKRSPGFYELSTILLAEMNIVEGKIQCILNGEPSAKQKKICTKKNDNIETILRNFEMYTELDLLKAIASNLRLL